jgi:chemotaxis protein MotA
MFAIVGIVVVFGAVLGGFLMEKGPMLVLMQPSEFLIIGGAAIGTLLSANPLYVLKKVVASLMSILKGSKYSRQRYIDSLKMMFTLFNKARKEGLAGIEADIEEPEKSTVFSKYPDFLSNHHARDFVCDTLRMAITGGASPFDLDQMMEQDMDVHHAGESQTVSALITMADSLPGLGIVAAVLGVVVTMSALGGPPEEIGHKVAAALVGTFLGILLCYGVVGPLASNLSKINSDEHSYYHVLRVVMLAFIKGMSPSLAIEMARRAIPEHIRPSFQEVEKTCRQKEEVGAAVAAYTDPGRTWVVAEAGEIIIIKKKAGHGCGHHGGAWKVAYADFVTAMMALFIVLWMMNASKQVQEAVGGYFKDPRGTAKVVGTNKNGAGEFVALKKEDMQKLKDQLLQSIHHLDPFDKLKNQIEITITPEGLRVELMESAKGTFFELGSAKPTPALVDLLKVLAQEIGKLPNSISIEGHTDSKAYTGKRTYDNWDLSSDRANEARRMMQAEGLRPGQISQVRGFADQRLRLPQNPEDPSNRRISLIVEYQVQGGSEVAPALSMAKAGLTKVPN